MGVPSPDVAGASDGDGWVWRWELPKKTDNQYRGEIVLVFKVDAFAGVLEGSPRPCAPA
jgi:hypothetical protein